ncbi:MAG TPA: hypothetical protein VIJ83_05955, partial [Solirubrobacteraceae bacterium]
YGSRARGEADPSETDPDRRSDVDLLVIAEGGDERHGAAVNSLRFEVAESLGESPFFFSVKVMDPEWLRGRREIESFVIDEVDRDKLVLYGDELGPRRRGEEVVSPARRSSCRLRASAWEMPRR